MILYLVQHAEARSKEEDPSRSLSDEGREHIRNVAEFVKGLDIKVRHILHSGKMRALQTAQILEQYIQSEMGVEEADGLAPMDDPGIWSVRLAQMSENTMIVGHLPHLAKLSTELLCGSKVKDIISFQMGNILCLKRSFDGNWMVEWIIKPGMFT
jgi:phosphohistidine phosphatase